MAKKINKSSDYSGVTDLQTLLHRDLKMNPKKMIISTPNL